MYVFIIRFLLHQQSFLALVIFAAAAGVMIGGAVIRQMNLQVGGMLKMILVCHVMALILITSFMLQCPARDFVGINKVYPNTSSDNHMLGLQAQCNSDCTCKRDWSPVCDVKTGNTYYSACFAGCRTKMNDNGTDKWTDCNCLETDNVVSLFLSEVSPNRNEDRELINGFCTRECGWKMWIFLTLLFFSVVASFASGIPSQQVITILTVNYLYRTYYR